MPIWIYLRKSRAESSDPDALAAHRSRLLRLASEQGYTTPPENIIEEIGSGDTLSARPRFRALLAHLRSLPKGSGGVLICMAVDRLTRGTMADRGEVHTALLWAGVEILTPERSYDLTRPADEFLFSLQCDLARNELSQYRQRVQEKKNELTRLGRQTSGKGGYGYEWDKNKKNLKPIWDELSTVRALFQEARDLSINQLAEKHGLPRSLISSILRNPTYSGYPARHVESYHYKNGEGTRGGRRMPRHRWLWPEKPGDYPAVVTLADWEAVQEALAGRKKSGRECRTVGGWCRDLVRFEGREVKVRLCAQKKLGARVETYQSPQGEPLIFVPREMVHQAAEAAIRRLLAHPSLLAELVQAAEDLQKDADQPAPRQESELRREMETLRANLDDLLAREQEEEDSEERASIGRRRAALRARLRALTADLQSLHRRSADTPSGWARLLKDNPALLGGGLAFWEEAAESVRRRLARLLIESITVRCTPRRAPQPWLREVIEVRLRPEIKKLMDS